MAASVLQPTIIFVAETSQPRCERTALLQVAGRTLAIPEAIEAVARVSPSFGFGKIPIRCAAAPDHDQPAVEKPSPYRLSLVHALLLTASKRVPDTKVSPSAYLQI